MSEPDSEAPQDDSRAAAPVALDGDAALSDRVICSSITLRHLPLQEALATIAGLGFAGVDVGALPGVCEHVPADLSETATEEVVAAVAATGLSVRSVNADMGDLNAVLDATAAAGRAAHLDALIALCVGLGRSTGGTGAPAALVLPAGGQSRDPVESLDTDLDRVAEQLTAAAERAADCGVAVWVEAPHLLRLTCDLERAAALYARLPTSGSSAVGAVLDTSHVVASGATPRAFLDRFAARTRHVHLRDASPGYIHHSIGRGQVDFTDTVAALTEAGYTGALALELETRDVADADRPAAALTAGRYITHLLQEPA